MNAAKVLHGVPRVRYGAFGGITPLPICLKAISDYLGDPVDYTYALVAGGGAFRLVWDTAGWNAGNVDIMWTYDDPETAFRYGITALGRGFTPLWRAKQAPTGDKEAFKALIREQIDAGRPLVSLGPVGPPEAGIIAGYRDGGDTLLGWSLFQDWEGAAVDEEGYFVTGSWWEEREFLGVMALGDVAAPRFGPRDIVRHAVAALEGRRQGSYAKGVAAYGPWKEALLGVTPDDFTAADKGLVDSRRVMMCQGDATDCLVDGRGHAAEYFGALAKERPEQPLYAEIAEQFAAIARTIHRDIYGALGGHERGPEQIRALAQPETRAIIAGCIDEMAAADGRALALMEKLLVVL